MDRIPDNVLEILFCPGVLAAYAGAGLLLRLLFFLLDRIRVRHQVGKDIVTQAGVAYEEESAALRRFEARERTKRLKRNQRQAAREARRTARLVRRLLGFDARPLESAGMASVSRDDGPPLRFRRIVYSVPGAQGPCGITALELVHNSEEFRDPKDNGEERNAITDLADLGRVLTKHGYGGRQ
jgi:hypothetical protein